MSSDFAARPLDMLRPALRFFVIIDAAQRDLRTGCTRGGDSGSAGGNSGGTSAAWSVGGGGGFEAADDTVAERAEALVAQLDGDLAADADEDNAGTWPDLGFDAATAHDSALGPFGRALGLSEAHASCLAKAAGAAPALPTDEPELSTGEWFDLKHFDVQTR
jgi:hypothetical protein